MLSGYDCYVIVTQRTAVMLLGMRRDRLVVRSIGDRRTMVSSEDIGNLATCFVALHYIVCRDNEGTNDAIVSLASYLPPMPRLHLWRH
jgi:hypothetical protein